MLRLEPEERPVAVQLLAAEPTMAASAAVLAVEAGADVLDINMGCCAPKVLRSGAGAALLCEPERAVAVLAAAVNAVQGRLPVTAKLRSGWDESAIVAPHLAVALADAGAAAVTVHGRTVAQGFRGAADWGVIADTKRACAVPVIGNGDVRCGVDAVRMMQETDCDAVMIGRAALGNPWVFGEARAALRGGLLPVAPTMYERLRVALEHCRGQVDLFGEKQVLHLCRKHVAWYTRGMPSSARIRARVSRAKTWAELQRLVSEFAELLTSIPPAYGVQRTQRSDGSEA